MKRLKLAYFILLHLVLVGVTWKSDFLNRVQFYFQGTRGEAENMEQYQRMLGFHSRSVEAVPDDAFIFIGDSLVQGLSVVAVHPLSVNYGIGRDTTKGVLDRLPIYMPALERAGGIVIAIGVNDLHYRGVDDALENYAQILASLPEGRPIFLSAILPVDLNLGEKFGEQGEWIEKFNQGLKSLAEERDGVTLIESGEVLDLDQDGRLDAKFHIGDGLHLNSAGNRVWAQRMREELQGGPNHSIK